MSSHSDYDDALDAERAINETYLRACREAQTRSWPFEGSANTIWGRSTPAIRRVCEPLIGRVALDIEDAELDDFYITRAHVDDDSVLFVSYVAPLAGLFYDGPNWDPARVPDRESAPDPRSLLARRTFEVRRDDITHFTDDPEPGVDRNSVFRRDAEPPTIPPPPAGPPAGPAPTGVEPPLEPLTRTADDAPEPEGGEPQDHLDPHGQDVDLPGPATAPADDRTGGRLARADRLVRETIDRPRATRLHSVLRTLQPDQYRYVTWSAEKHLAVQGHPGTGKTIVATHRAAFLTHADNPGRLRRVALVGPTDEWTTHVYSVLDETGAQGVEVISVETLVRGLAEGKLARENPAGGFTQPLHRENEHSFQTDWMIGRVADRALVELADQLSRLSNAEKKVQLVAMRIIEACTSGSDLVNDLTPDCRDWLSSARSYENTRTDASYLLFLASIGMAILPPSSKALYEHVIVDEVQDLRPAEWRILDTLLRPEGRWSLFGDMNQRRADVSWDSWKSLLTNLGVGPEDGSALEPEILDTGYRSNDLILRYAGWLLPRRERSHGTLRRGSEDAVRVRRVRSSDLFARAEEEARQLAEEFSDGVVAVIVWSQDHLDGVRDNVLEWGWRRVSGPANRTTFTLREPPKSGAEPIRRATLRIMRAVQARGLEFDGVVVVEPADFQKNLGRHGSLYTSLTRADKKLVVVHSRPLPKELKGRVRPDPARR
ncbi:MAG: AAA family ATPase [bacterium]|nr:AAA family ATPase [bacterium]